VQELEKPNTVEEIKLVLQRFSKDKSPGPDGWTVEFFLKYFDILGTDVQEVVEESRSWVLGCLIIIMRPPSP
jgi:hypothetical protein